MDSNNNPLSYSFTPGLAQRFRSTANGSSALPSGASSALQVLALQLPDILSGSYVAPDSLLRGPRPVSGQPVSPSRPAGPGSTPFGNPIPDAAPSAPPGPPGAPRITVPSVPQQPNAPTPNVPPAAAGHVPTPMGNDPFAAGSPFQGLMSSIFGPNNFR